ncbi:MAG TPA: carboxypeptidase regulatory-like domain-containing protein [Bryobacteraceae bacterium]|nr:carboxypeptidase regulatory-like domain-containing protein [Bryobacteraceae bacterium]
MFRTVATLVSGILLSSLLFAQSDRGSITGTVMDPAGAMVPAAAVVARNTETGSVFQSVTTQTGNYTIPSLPVGVYELSVEAPGFKKSTQTGLQIQVAQTIRLDLTLQIGSAAETVNVTAEAPMLRTENAEQSVNVSGNRINALPLNFGGGGGSTGTIRSWTSFIVLSPGVSGTGTGARVNGIPPNNFKIIVEGQDVTSGNDTGWTSTVTQASVEMIQEFSLQTSNFAAEFGQVGGGLFNFTTRSGTNQFHGSAYNYFQNEALDAYRPVPLRARPRSRKNNFGGTIGGPVWIPKLFDGRNRTFFFFNYEMFRTNVTSAGNLATLPTDAYRSGDFSAALTGRQLGTDPLGRPIMENTIYDPLTSRTVNGVVVRDRSPAM